MKLVIITIANFFISVSCAPTAPYAVHEKRHVGDLRWRPRDVELDSGTVFPLSIGLTQQNLHKGHDFLMDVSHPNSPNYANHWTLEQVYRESLMRVFISDVPGCRGLCSDC